MPSFDPEKVSAEKVQQEMEQMHAAAMDRLRASEDFVLFSFDTDEKLWRTSAAVGKYQDLETIQGLFNCIHKFHDQMEQTNQAILNKAILEQNAEDWKTMDDDEKGTLRLMLTLLMGHETAERIISDMEKAGDD
jgi:hypothetical protein